MNKSVSEGKTSVWFLCPTVARSVQLWSLLFCPTYFHLRLLLGAKRLKKKKKNPNSTAMYILWCWQQNVHSCQCLQCNETFKTLRRGHQNSKTCDHIITRSHLPQCDLFLFFLVCFRLKQAKKVMNLLFCAYPHRSHPTEWYLRCPLCSCILSVKVFCVQQAVHVINDGDIGTVVPRITCTKEGLIESMLRENNLEKYRLIKIYWEQSEFL